MTTLQELKTRAMVSNKHIAAASADLAWELTIDEIKSLEINHSRYNRMMARYDENQSEETLGLIRHMVASAIQNA